MIVGISGPSGSGKTTIARALRHLYLSSSTTTQVRILHQDDFYKPESEIPMKQTRSGIVVNWDCAESIDMEALVHTMQRYRSQGAFDASLEHDLAIRAKEDQNESGTHKVSENLIRETISSGSVPIVPPGEGLLVLDGFMLFHDPMVKSLIDVPILLRGSFETLKRRREDRSGYVTLEGFWKDPEHYFEDCVWPEYLDSHGDLFVNGDVEGPIRNDVGILVNTKVDTDLDQSFRFVIDSMHKYLVDRPS